MNGQTLVNLEIFGNNVDGGLSGKFMKVFSNVELVLYYQRINLNSCLFNICIFNTGTLYKYLDQCCTSSGKRLLKRWICHPLTNSNEIDNRLNVVEGLVKNQATSSVIAEYLRKIPDLERLLGLVKSSVVSSIAYLLPTFGVRLLKKQVS